MEKNLRIFLLIKIDCLAVKTNKGILKIHPFCISDVTPLCPNGGIFFRNECFWVGKKGTLPMHEADQSCQEEYGENARLPVIRDAEMNVRIRVYFTVTL